MTRIVTSAALVLLAAAAALARGTGGDAPPLAPQPSLPLGPWARAGRPVVVRVPGARRVRAAGSPWALPQGAAFDEFLLQVVRADVTLRDLEIDDGAGRAPRSAQLDLRTLPAALPVRAAFSGTPSDGRVVVPASGLPTIAEAWLLFDDVEEPPDGLPPAVRSALDAWRAGPRPGAGGRAAFQPVVAPPGPSAFAAAAEVAASAPRLPRDVALALLVTALAEAAVLVLAARRTPARRAAWLAAAPLVCLAWLVADARLPGAVRATLLRLDSASDRLVVLRLEAPRGGDASFSVPPEAGAPALLRYDSDDLTGLDAELGREVRLTIPPGQSRLVAWRMPPETPGEGGGGDAPGSAPADSKFAEWVRSLGLEAAGGAPDASVPLIETVRGFRPVRGGAVRVAARPAERK